MSPRDLTGTYPIIPAMKLSSFRVWRHGLVLAFSAACLPRGYVDVQPRLCAGADDGVGLCADEIAGRAGSVPLALTSCMNAEMRVLAYQGDRLIKRWHGQIRWTGVIEDGGNIYAGEIGNAGDVHQRRIVWRSRTIPEDLRIETDEYGHGGLALAQWLPPSTTRFVVFIRQGYGSGVGSGVGDTRAGGSSSHHRGARAVSGRGDSTATAERAKHDRRALGGGRHGTGRGSLPRSGDPCGEFAGGPSGQRGGVSARAGGVANAWAPTPWGERYGDPEGARGGDGERGKAGIRGAWALWGGLIGVSRELRAAAEVAVIAADVVNPTDLARRAAARVSGRIARARAAELAAQIRRELAREASKYARAEIKRLRPHIAAEFAGQPAAELRRRLRAFYNYKQLQYFEMFEAAAGNNTILRRAVRVKPVDGQLPKNHAYAGEILRIDAREYPEAARLIRQRGRAGVKFTKDGYPVFDPWVYTEGQIKAEVWIPNQRTYYDDFKLADKAMGERLGERSWVHPSSHTWHHDVHIQSGRTRMLLVPRDLHAAVRHTGGIPHYRVLTGDYDAYQRFRRGRPTRR